MDKSFEKLSLENLKLGDVVRMLNHQHEDIPSGGFNSLTVVNKTKDCITFFRPYVSLGNFTHTGGVTPYIGVEQFSVPFGNPVQYRLLDNIYRGEP